MARFSKWPTWWVRDSEKNFFPTGQSAGVSIAGLKCFIALSLTLDFNSLESVQSIDKLEQLTGLSRPMVIKGLRHLESMTLIEIMRGGHSHSYKVIESNGQDKGWAKIPYALAFRELKVLPNRGAVALLTLKVYAVLLSIRPNMSVSVSISYEKLLAYTNGQRSDVRRALDILVTHRLISCRKADDMNAPNIYTILGIDP